MRRERKRGAETQRERERERECGFLFDRRQVFEREGGVGNLTKFGVRLSKLKVAVLAQAGFSYEGGFVCHLLGVDRCLGLLEILP